MSHLYPESGSPSENRVLASSQDIQSWVSPSVRVQAAMNLPPMATDSVPSPYPSAAMTSADSSGLFVKTPFEIRDSIYRFLLSTRHTTKYFEEPGIAGSTEYLSLNNDS